MSRGTLWSLSLLQSLHRCREQGLFCDTHLRSADGETLAAHSCVLAAASSLLCQKLADSPASCKPYCLQTSLPHKVLSWVVNYVYSGLPHCHEGVINASDILAATTELGLVLSERELQEVVEVPRKLGNEEGVLTRASSSQQCKVEESGDDDNTMTASDHVNNLPWKSKTEDLNIKAESIHIGLDSDALGIPKSFGSKHAKKRKPRCKTTPRKVPLESTSGDETDAYYPDHMEVCPKVQKQQKSKRLLLQESSNDESEDLHVPLVIERKPHVKKLRKSHKPKKKRDDRRQKKGKNPCVPTKPKEKSYQCEFCPKMFFQSNHLQQHVKTHALSSPHLCRFCGQTFTRKTDMHTHERNSHFADEQFQCKVCQESFMQQIDLVEHQKVHVRGKQYHCSVCNRAFNRKLHLVQHGRLHTGERPYVCGFCGKAFTVRHNLTAHERIHTGEKPYKCSYCNMSFNQRNVLIQHERRHTGEKPFNCRYCDKTFAAKHYVANHERTHTGERPFQCSYCGSAFKKRDNLRVHERTHTGERPFKCRYCPESFPIGHSLHVHERIHTGDKPYVCGTCGEAFMQRTALLSHDKVHAVEKLEQIQTGGVNTPILQPPQQRQEQLQQQLFVVPHNSSAYTGPSDRSLYWPGPPLNQ